MEELQTTETAEQPASIWQELDAWAQVFEPWQRFVLAHAVRLGKLTDQQIDQAYTLFLQDNGLAEAPDSPVAVPGAITGRPAADAGTPIWLRRIGNLRAINALPAAAELTFSPSLTVIYGGNGVGKSGFVRILSNVCFSRKQHPILPNIYEDSSEAEGPGAQITIMDGSQQESMFNLDGSVESSELKRISVFDSAVAQTLLIDSGPLGFKPTGFDVFVEMARVYGQIAARLVNEIKRRTCDNRFIKSFVGADTEVSKFVATLGARTDIETLRALATFGEGEEARLVEVQRLKRELETKSVPETIKHLEEAKRCVETLKQRMVTATDLLSDDKRQLYRARLADFAAKAKVLAESGSGSFGHPSLKGVGSPQWERFLGAARDLAALEDTNYPRDTDHCLLCHRPLDEASVALIRRFWGFLVGDARREVEQASATLDDTVKALKAMQLGFFAEDTTTYGHVMRLNQELAKLISALVGQMDNDRKAIVEVLEAFKGAIPQSALVDVSDGLNKLGVQIEVDITTFKAEKIEDALKTLEAERLTLRHKQVLNRLLPDAEAFVDDLSWAAAAAGTPKSSLNPRPLTDKEKELFNTVIAGKYKEQLARECELLNCNLPVEFQTRGQQGKLSAHSECVEGTGLTRS